MTTGPLHSQNWRGEKATGMEHEDELPAVAEVRGTVER